MKRVFAHLLLGYLLSFIPTNSWAETYDDLYKKGGVYYKKFTDVPFTGEIIQKFERGTYKNGKLHGTYYNFDEKGRMTFRGEYKNGLGHGLMESYNTNPFDDQAGHLAYKGNEKNGKKEGYWEWYNLDGSVNARFAGFYKGGVKVSD